MYTSSMKGLNYEVSPSAEVGVDSVTVSRDLTRFNCRKPLGFWVSSGCNLSHGDPRRDLGNVLNENYEVIGSAETPFEAMEIIRAADTSMDYDYFNSLVSHALDDPELSSRYSDLFKTIREAMAGCPSGKSQIFIEAIAEACLGLVNGDAVACGIGFAGFSEGLSEELSEEIARFRKEKA